MRDFKKEVKITIDDLSEEDKMTILSSMSFEFEGKQIGAKEFMEKINKSPSEILDKLKNNPKVIKAIENFEMGIKAEELAIEEARKKYGEELTLSELSDRMPEEEKIIFFEKILENPRVLNMAIKHLGIEK